LSFSNEYKIYLVFNNHKEGVVDLKTIITKDHRPIFIELSNIEKFKVEADTVVWENGMDLAPEFLYEKLETK
jgi:hypothetical protein